MDNPTLNQAPGYRVRRVGGYLHKLIPIVDGTGKVVSHAIAPLMVELRPRDVTQINERKPSKRQLMRRASIDLPPQKRTS